jgi:hypothetical protein
VLEPHVPTEADVVPDAELLDACEEERRQARRQEARNAALLAEIDRRQSYRLHGYLSTTAYALTDTRHAHGRDLADLVALSRPVSTRRSRPACGSVIKGATG